MEEASKATTPWPSLLGQKGQRYDIYILETVLMLMAGGLPAEEAVGSLAVFLQQPYPALSAGTDYRIPGPWFFKAAAQCLYPLGLMTLVRVSGRQSAGWVQLLWNGRPYCRAVCVH